MNLSQLAEGSKFLMDFNNRPGVVLSQGPGGTRVVYGVHPDDPDNEYLPAKLPFVISGGSEVTLVKGAKITETGVVVASGSV